MNVVHYEPPDHDGFTTGLVEYIDRENIDTYEMMMEGVSSVIPMFRKAKDYLTELEYRAILRPGSLSVKRALAAGKTGLIMRVKLEELLLGMRYAPVGDSDFLGEVETILNDRPDLRGRLCPSDIKP